MTKNTNSKTKLVSNDKKKVKGENEEPVLNKEDKSVPNGRSSQNNIDIPNFIEKIAKVYYSLNYE